MAYKNSARKSKPKTARRLENTNRIVRVYNNRTNTILQKVSNDLGCPYQLVFDEFLEIVQDQLDINVPTWQEIITNRLLEKYTGE